MTEFFRFPSTPYVSPPAGLDLRLDKALTPAELTTFLSQPLHVEEKVDGENLGISNGENGLVFQARGSHVTPGGRHFSGLDTWVRPRASRLAAALGDNLVLFGEWCAVTHSVRYDALPDWFLVFDIYQRSTRRFWKTDSRDAFADDLGLHVVPFLTAGVLDEAGLGDLVGDSRLGRERMEGVVAREQGSAGAQRRAKVVRSDFLQRPDQHWMSSGRSMNRLASGRG